VLLTSCFPIANLDFIFPFSVTAELFVRVGVQKTFLSVGTPFSTFYFFSFCCRSAMFMLVDSGGACGQKDA